MTEFSVVRHADFVSSNVSSLDIHLAILTQLDKVMKVCQFVLDVSAQVGGAIERCR